MNSIRKLFIPIIILAVSVLLNGCDAQALDTYVSNENAPVSTSNSEFGDNKDELPVRKEPDSKEAVDTGDTPPDDGSFIPASSAGINSSQNASKFDLSSVPEYSNQASVIINNNEPFFTDTDITTESFERYSPLDSKGRCGVAFASFATMFNLISPSITLPEIAMLTLSLSRHRLLQTLPANLKS